jgi:hypothetical protein
MKLSFSALAAAGAMALAVLGGTPASASTPVYDNGPINGTVDAWTINFGYQVSNSFTVAGPTSLTGAQVGLWLFPGDTATSVEWSIGTSPYSSNIGTGTAALTQTPAGTSPYGYPLAEDTFALTGNVTSGTTYYLTLQNASAPSGDPIYWDENNGPSTAYESAYGNLAGHDGTNSESFQLYGTPAAVPEFGTLASFGGIIATSGLALLRRRRAA